MRISIANLILIGSAFVAILGWGIAQWINYNDLQRRVSEDDEWIKDTRRWCYVAVYPAEQWSKDYKATHRWIDKP